MADTPPGINVRPRSDEVIATQQSYDDIGDEVSHGLSASVGLTLLAVVMWVSVIVGERLPSLAPLRIEYLLVAMSPMACVDIDNVGCRGSGGYRWSICMAGAVGD